jgi:hypothetical protein
MKPSREFWREMLSENGNGSSKRLFGGIAILVALGCIIYLTVTEGCTDCVEGLLQVLIITSCSLLGLSSITGIWKNGKVSTLQEKKKEEENE